MLNLFLLAVHFTLCLSAPLKEQVALVPTENLAFLTLEELSPEAQKEWVTGFLERQVF